MDVNIIDKSNWQKTIEVKLAIAELEPDFEKAYREHKKNITIGGFRKGKVPVDLIKRIFGKEIQAKVVEKKIPDIIVEISKEHKFDPITSPKIEDFSFTAEDGLKFTVFLEIVPQIEVQNYKGLSLEKEVYEVGPEDLQDALEDLREQHAIMTNIEGEAKIGHYIIADVQKLDRTGVPIIGEKYENRFFQLTETDNGKENELTKQLLGLKVGDNRQIKLTVLNRQNQQPMLEDYSITIKEINEKTLPTIDDEFAKDVGDFEALTDLNAKLKEDLEHQIKEDSEQIFAEKVIDELVKSTVFEVPEPMISNYLDLVIEKMKEDPKNKNFDEHQFRQNYRADTIRRIKWTMIRERLCELENIQVIDSEVDSYIENLTNKDVKNRLQIINYYHQKEKKNQLRDELLDRKIVHFIAEHAEIKEKHISRKDIVNQSKIIV